MTPQPAQAPTPSKEAIAAAKEIEANLVFGRMEPQRILDRAIIIDRHFADLAAAQAQVANLEERSQVLGAVEVWLAKEFQPGDKRSGDLLDDFVAFFEHHKAVEAQVATLREALTATRKELVELVKGEDCDHSVGICWCETFRTIDRATEALKKTPASVGDELAALRNSVEGWKSSFAQKDADFQEAKRTLEKMSDLVMRVDGDSWEKNVRLDGQKELVFIAGKICASRAARKEA